MLATFVTIFLSLHAILFAKRKLHLGEGQLLVIRQIRGDDCVQTQRQQKRSNNRLGHLAIDLEQCQRFINDRWQSEGEMTNGKLFKLNVLKKQAKAIIYVWISITIYAASGANRLG